MKSKKFVYRTDIKWQGERKGLLSSPDKPDVEIATPPEFRGHRGVWTPEDLFVASVNSCIMTTFLYYAERENLEFLSYKSEAEGILENVDGKFIFSTIMVKPRIQLKSRDNLVKAQELIEIAEKRCLISNSIRSQVTVSPEIWAGQETSRI